MKNTTANLFQKLLLASAVLAFAFVCGVPAHAQNRADDIAKQQAEKARTAEPYRPNRVEHFFGQAEQGKWPGSACARRRDVLQIVT